MNINTDLSHNIYSEIKTFTLKELPNYLILNKENDIGYATNISDAIKMATENTNDGEGARIYELIRTQKGYWRYKCDITKGWLS